MLNFRNVKIFHKLLNLSKSIFPPEIITTTVLFFKFIFFVNAAVAATAPPGSTIIFKCSAKILIECFTSSSSTTIPPDKVLRFIGKVYCPGWGVIIASQIEWKPGLLEIIFLLIREIFVSSNP